jgi:hypothetical protein
MSDTGGDTLKKTIDSANEILEKLEMDKIVDLNSEEKFKNWMLSKLELPIKFPNW